MIKINPYKAKVAARAHGAASTGRPDQPMESFSPSYAVNNTAFPAQTPIAVKTTTAATKDGVAEVSKPWKVLVWSIDANNVFSLSSLQRAQTHMVGQSELISDDLTQFLLDGSQRFPSERTLLVVSGGQMESDAQKAAVTEIQQSLKAAQSAGLAKLDVLALDFPGSLDYQGLRALDGTTQYITAMESDVDQTQRINLSELVKSLDASPSETEYVTGAILQSIPCQPTLATAASIDLAKFSKVDSALQRFANQLNQEGKSALQQSVGTGLGSLVEYVDSWPYDYLKSPAKEAAADEAALKLEQALVKSLISYSYGPESPGWNVLSLVDNQVSESL